MIGVPRYKVFLVEHDEKWAEEFENVKRTLINIHGENVNRHSTQYCNKRYNG